MKGTYVVGSFHNDISYAPVVDEDSLEALGLLSDHVPHHHQPIQTSSVVLYYSIVRKKPPSTTYIVPWSRTSPKQQNM